MHEARIIRGKRFAQRRFVNFRAKARQKSQFRAAGKKLRGAAFIAFDMSFLMARNRAN